MIGRVPLRKSVPHPTPHGGLVMSPENSQLAEDNPPPASPAETTVSSSTMAGSVGGSPVAPARADPKLDALLKLVTNTVASKRSIDKEAEWLSKENNSIIQEQVQLDQLQEALRERRYKWEDREDKAKRARALFNEDMVRIDQSITHPDDDPEC